MTKEAARQSADFTDCPDWTSTNRQARMAAEGIKAHLVGRLPESIAAVAGRQHLRGLFRSTSLFLQQGLSSGFNPPRFRVPPYGNPQPSMEHSDEAQIHLDGRSNRCWRPR